MTASNGRSLEMSRRIVLLMLSVTAVALTFTPLGSAQATDIGGSATGTGAYGGFGFFPTETLTLLGVTGTPTAATGTVTYSTLGAETTATGEARCIAIDETATGFRASIAGEVTGGTLFLQFGVSGFEVTVYDNTPPPPEQDQVSNIIFFFEPRTSCAFDYPADEFVERGDFTVTPAGDACPANDDEDGDGLTNNNESLFSTLLGNDDSDFDGIADGNDDANGNGEDDEDEDDDEGDGCPDQDSDGDGEDDEDEDDEEDDD